MHWAKYWICQKNYTCPSMTFNKWFSDSCTPLFAQEPPGWPVLWFRSYLDIVFNCWNGTRCFMGWKLPTAEFVQYTQEFGDSREYQWHVPFVIFATLFQGPFLKYGESTIIQLPALRRAIVEARQMLLAVNYIHGNSAPNHRCPKFQLVGGWK